MELDILKKHIEIQLMINKLNINDKRITNDLKKIILTLYNLKKITNLQKFEIINNQLLIDYFKISYWVLDDNSQLFIKYTDIDFINNYKVDINIKYFNEYINYTIKSNLKGYNQNNYYHNLDLLLNQINEFL